MAEKLKHNRDSRVLAMPTVKVILLALHPYNKTIVSPECITDRDFAAKLGKQQFAIIFPL